MPIQVIDQTRMSAKRSRGGTRTARRKHQIARRRQERCRRPIRFKAITAAFPYGGLYVVRNDLADMLPVIALHLVIIDHRRIEAEQPDQATAKDRVADVLDLRAAEDACPVLGIDRGTGDLA